MKVWKYVVVSVALIMLLRFGGLPTGNENLFNTIGVSFDAVTGIITTISSTDSTMFNFLFKAGAGILAVLVLVGGAAAVSFVTRAQFENIILLPFVTSILVLFVSVGFNLMNHAYQDGHSWTAAIMLFLMMPFTIGFILALAEFFRGTD